MKKILALFLVFAISLSFTATSFADDSIQRREVYITDGIEFNVEIVDYAMSVLLSQDKKQLMDEANEILFNEIPETDGCYSLYWPEPEPSSDSEMITITLNIYNFEFIDSYTFRYYLDGELIEVEPEIDYDNHTVTVTIPRDTPLAISCEYGDIDAVQFIIDSVSGKAKGIAGTGGKAGALPSVIFCPANLIPMEFFDDLTEEERQICLVGIESVESQIPDGMTVRYLFWGDYSYYDDVEKIEKEDYDYIYRMDDLLKGDHVVVKCYDGEWEVQECEVKEDGKLFGHMTKTGLVAIFTDKETSEEDK